ncbi:sugar ABC transporter substrate-binding protein [Blastococcus litoris]|uniref:sugar ABC transporter substrate-binding protein n=1 Tax=Blastococcus litoris TaxID=2171622 RepID=UPI000E3081AE|nr:substrate-binding domain-containing protein [Blastococcus litoris]
MKSISKSSAGRRPHRRPGAAVALLATAALTLAACGAGEDGASASAGSGDTSGLDQAQENIDGALKAPTEISQTTELSEAPPSSGSVIFLANAVPATSIIGDGVQEAAEAIDWDYDEVTYDTANPATLQSALMTALSKEPSAVVVTGVSPDLYGEATVKAYEEAGVPIVAAGVCPVKATETIIAGPSNCDQENSVGSLLADWIAVDSEGTGQVLHANVTAYPSYLAVADGLESELGTACPDCELQTIELTAAQVSDGQVVPTTVNTLRANPGIKYVVFDNAAYTNGFDAAAKAAGLTDITVVGRQADQAAITALQNGGAGAWTVSSYQLLGYGALDAALRAITDSDGFEGNFVAPIQVLDADNAADVSVPYNQPEGALDQYLALWQVG